MLVRDLFAVANLLVTVHFMHCMQALLAMVNYQFV